MPYNPLADNTELTAAHLLAEVYNQVISQVTSASRPGSPAEGQMIYETDTGLLQLYNGTAWVPFGGVDAWSNYTPAFTQSVAVTKTVSYARYVKMGRLVVVSLSLSATSAGTAGNPIAVGIPITAAAAGVWAGAVIVYDSSVTTVYPGLCAVAGTTHVSFTDTTAATTVNVYLGQGGTAFSAALASGDIVSLFVVYEAAP